MGETAPAHGAPDESDVVVEVEVIDGPLVLASSRAPVLRQVPLGPALVQTAAVAATGFVAGVATAAVLGRRRQRRLTAPAAGGVDPSVRAVSHRTYLVDVRLLERR
ncbi:MAG TPA: hypothetical protein VG165_09510 [Solirubrobacteraceae bacterium]|jgi:hypothetical protein|nr:hypothetical protein [Solirubrobacteraceae bacterium]